MLKLRFLNMLENQRSCKLQYNLPLVTNEGQVEGQVENCFTTSVIYI